MKLIAGLILFVGVVAIAEANPRRRHHGMQEEMPEIITIDLDSSPLEGLMSLLAPKEPSEDTELLRSILRTLEQISSQFEQAMPNNSPQYEPTPPDGSDDGESSEPEEPSNVTDVVPAPTGDNKPQDLPPTPNDI